MDVRQRITKLLDHRYDVLEIEGIVVALKEDCIQRLPSQIRERPEGTAPGRCRSF